MVHFVEYMINGDIIVTTTSFEDNKTITTQSIIKNGSSSSKENIEVDSSLSLSSSNPVQNSVITKSLNEKQDKLVSGKNIKTINQNTLLGEGDISINDTKYDENDGVLSIINT